MACVKHRPFFLLLTHPHAKNMSYQCRHHHGKRTPEANPQYRLFNGRSPTPCRQRTGERQEYDGKAILEVYHMLERRKYRYH